MLSNVTFGLNLFFSIVAAVGLFGFIAWFEHAMAKAGDGESFFKNRRAWIGAATCAGAVGLSMIFRPLLAPGWLGVLFSLLFMAIDVAVFVYLCYVFHRYHEEDGEWKQIIPLAVVFIAMSFVTAVTMATMADAMNAHSYFRTLFGLIPWFLLVGSIGYVAIDSLYGRAEEAEDAENDDEAEAWTTRGRIGIGIVSFILAMILIFGAIVGPWASLTDLFKSNKKSTTDNNLQAQASATEAAATNAEKSWLTYQEVTQKYPWLTWNNFVLQSDGDPDNNANFGPDRHHEGWTATDYFQDMKSFDESDVMILVAHVAAVDAARDTRMVGDYYDGNDHDWARTMNALVVKCLNDKVDFMHFSEVYLNMLRNEVRSVRVVHMDDINDQMYITPYTYSGVPEIVASETHQSGDVLIVTFKRKGGEENDTSVGFRIDCCYQPVGVIDTMKLPNTKVEIPPEHTPDGSTPTNPDKPAGGSDPTKPAGGSDPTEPPKTTPTYNKDKTQGIKDPGNVEQGLDENTNNGVGATTSTKDRDSNSNYGSYNEYQQAVEQNKSANTTSNSGSGGTSSSSSAKVDSNDDGGYTPKSDAAQTVDDKSIANNPDNPAGVYGGLPD